MAPYMNGYSAQAQDKNGIEVDRVGGSQDTAEAISPQSPEEIRRELLMQLVNAKDEERKRIARDLHDRTGQYVTTLLFGMKSLENTLPSDSPERAKARQLHETTSALYQELHVLTTQLRPKVLEDLGLCPALMDYVAEWSKLTGIDTDFHSVGLLHLAIAPEIESTIYYFVQEVLTNIYRHTKATKVNILAERRDNEILAIAEDNGEGFDVENVLASTERLGLRGMRERLDAVGGTIDIESAPAQGTTLYLRIPLVAAEL